MGWRLITHNLKAHEWPPFNGQTGINYTGAEIKLKHIIDGISKTYMVGEKYLTCRDSMKQMVRLRWRRRRQPEHVSRIRLGHKSLDKPLDTNRHQDQVGL